MCDLETIGQDIKEIKDALLGTDYNSKGLIKRVDDLEEWKKEMEIIRWKIFGGAMAISALIGILINVAIKLL